MLFANCSTNKQNKITAHVSIINKVNPVDLQEDQGIFYSVKIELINNTDSVFRFWTETCSWQRNWIFVNSSFNFYVDCKSNFPQMSQIEPNERIIYNGIIAIDDTTHLSGIKELKLGFVLVKKNEVKHAYEYIPLLMDKIKTRKDIIWSETFKIPSSL